LNLSTDIYMVNVTKNVHCILHTKWHEIEHYQTYLAKILGQLLKKLQEKERKFNVIAINARENRLILVQRRDMN
jgi:hypothetical protein